MENLALQTSRTRPTAKPEPLKKLSLHQCQLNVAYVVSEGENGRGEIEQVPVERVLKPPADQRVVLGGRLLVVADGVDTHHERVVSEQDQSSVPGDVGLGQQQGPGVLVHRHHTVWLLVTATSRPRLGALRHQVRLSLLHTSTNEHTHAHTDTSSHTDERDQYAFRDAYDSREM